MTGKNRNPPSPTLAPAARVLEALLTIMVAVALARLIWAATTPAGPLGDWQGARPAPLTPAPAAGFDPFFRDAGPADTAVSDLDIVLMGTRVDTVSGRGSAIIATPDGRQASYLVGEAVLPGVTLKAVAFDTVTLARGGRDERLFLDQSDPPSGAAGRTATPAATPLAPPTIAAPPASPAIPPPASLPVPVR